MIAGALGWKARPVEGIALLSLRGVHGSARLVLLCARLRSRSTEERNFPALSEKVALRSRAPGLLTGK